MLHVIELPSFKTHNNKMKLLQHILNIKVAVLKEEHVTLFNMRNCISEFPKAFYESGI
jgi:hypothetical protein